MKTKHKHKKNLKTKAKTKRKIKHKPSHYKLTKRWYSGGGTEQVGPFDSPAAAAAAFIANKNVSFEDPPTSGLFTSLTITLTGGVTEINPNYFRYEGSYIQMYRGNIEASGSWPVTAGASTLCDNGIDIGVVDANGDIWCPIRN